MYPAAPAEASGERDFLFGFLGFAVIFCRTPAVMAEITPLSYGFGVTWSEPGPMPHTHQHNDLEVGYVIGGQTDLIFGGRRIDLPLRQIFVTWAGIPHQGIPRPKVSVFVMSIPLAWALRWKLPRTFLNDLMKGGFWVDQTGDPDFDTASFRRWESGLKNRTPEMEKIVSLEVEARLRRLILAGAVSHARTRNEKPQKEGSSMDKAVLMSAYIVDHFSDEITAEDVAGAAGLNTTYASTVFRKFWGVTLSDFVARQRISYAQQLLINEDATVLDVAMRCGFGSATQFYHHFKRICGNTPHDYMEQFARESQGQAEQSGE